MNNSISLANSSDFVAIAGILESLEGDSVVRKLFRTQGLPEDLRYQPELYFPNAELIRFIENSARSAGLDFFGLTVGAAFRFADLGLYGTYVTNAPNLGVAIVRACRAAPYYESGSSLETVEAGDSIILRYHPASPSAIGGVHQSDALVLMLTDLVRNFTDPEWYPEYIELNYDIMGRNSKLTSHFSAPVSFGKPGIGIPVLKKHLSKQNLSPLNHESPITIHDVHRLHVNKPPATFTDIINNQIMLSENHSSPDIDKIADQLGIGIRTLQRHLSHDGHSFRDLTNVACLKRANELLTDTNFTIREISSKLGYSSKQNFLRAYKKQADMTPGQARKIFIKNSL